MLIQPNWFICYFIHIYFLILCGYLYLNSSLHWSCLLCKFHLINLDYCRSVIACGALQSSGTKQTSSPSFPAAQKTCLINKKQSKRSTPISRNEEYESFTACFMKHTPFIISMSMIWHATPSDPGKHMHLHSPSIWITVPPFWQGWHLHTLYSATYSSRALLRLSRLGWASGKLKGMAL